MVRAKNAFPTVSNEAASRRMLLAGIPCEPSSTCWPHHKKHDKQAFYNLQILLQVVWALNSSIQAAAGRMYQAR